jgi:hypothetical protein
MDDKIRQLAWNIVLEHNRISSLLSDNLDENGQLSEAKFEKSRQNAVEFVARLLEHALGVLNKS